MLERSVGQDDRRQLLERIDISAAVFDSLLSELKALPISDVQGQVMMKEKLVKEYAVGKYGDLQVPESEKMAAPCNDRVKIDMTVLNEAEDALSHLRSQISSADISNDLIRAGRGHVDTIIQKKLKDYDPLAGKIESAIEKAKREVDSDRRALDDKRSALNNNDAYKIVKEQIEKRESLIAIYRSESTKLKYSQCSSNKHIGNSWRPSRGSNWKWTISESSTRKYWRSSMKRKN